MTHGEREGALVGLLDALAGSRLEDWRSAPTRTSDAAYDGGLRVLATLFLLRWDDAAALGRSLPEPDDDDARWTHLAVLAWASAGDPGPRSSSVLEPFEDDDARPAVETVVGRFAAYLAVEAAMAHARLDLAARLAERLGEAVWDPLGHPVDLMVTACRARLLAFRGDVGGARLALEGVDASASGSLAGLLAGTRCLVHGNDADPVEVRRLAAAVEETAASPRDLPGVGSQMLAAFGLIAIGDVTEAVRRLLVAGGDQDLSTLNVIDRALGLELLVSLAVAGDDLDDAEVWRDRALPLLASPIADSTVARLMSRVELLAGEPGPIELIVADGGSTDRGPDRAIAAGATVVVSGPGRGRQLAAGARLATGDILLFLHADAQLPPPGATDLVRAALADARVEAGAFVTRTVPDRTRRNLAGPLLRLADLRSRFARLPHGEQALFVRRSAYEAVGGFRPLPVCEDQDLARRLAARAPLVKLRQPVTVSGRSLQSRPLHALLVHGAIPPLFRLGVDPTLLARLYRSR